MGDHLIDGEFQSDKYPTTPRGKVPLSVKDPTAQDLLWTYAQRRRSVDAEFASDLEQALRNAGYVPSTTVFDEVKAEQARQATAWGGPAHDDTHSVVDWHLILSMQLGKLASEILGDWPVNKQPRTRLIKIAAVAVSAVESITRWSTPAGARKP